MTMAAAGADVTKAEQDAVYVSAVITALENRMHPWHVIFVQQDLRALKDYTRWCEALIMGAHQRSDDVLMRLIAEHDNDDNPVFYIFVFLATLTCLQSAVEQDITQRMDVDTGLPAEINPKGLRAWIGYAVPQVRRFLQGLPHPTDPGTFVFPDFCKDGSSRVLYKGRSEMCAENNDRCVTTPPIRSACGLVPVERIANDRYLTMDFFVQEMCHAYVFYVDSCDSDMVPFTLAGVPVTSAVILDRANQIFKDREKVVANTQPISADDVAVSLLRRHALWSTRQLRASAVEQAGLYTRA